MTARAPRSRRARRVTAVLALGLWATFGMAALLPSVAGAARAADNPHPVTVQVDRTRIDSQLGGRFSLSATVRNRTDGPLSGLIAHLNVLSSDPGTYVDPEDWSSRRTQFLGALPAGGRTTLTFDVQAVNTGPIVLYVAVTDQHGGSVTASPPVELAVQQQQSIDSGGILPLALGLPAAVAALLIVVRVRQHRR